MSQECDPFVNALLDEMVVAFVADGLSYFSFENFGDLFFSDLGEEEEKIVGVKVRDFLEPADFEEVGYTW